MALTLNQAAKTCGRSKSTLLEAIRAGRMSAPKDDRGHYAIDPSELHRAFPFRVQEWSSDQSTEPEPTSVKNQSGPADCGLKREIELLRGALTDVRTDRDKWRDMAERLSLAPPTSEAKTTTHPSFWARLTGRRNR